MLQFLTRVISAEITQAIPTATIELIMFLLVCSLSPLFVFDSWLSIRVAKSKRSIDSNWLVSPPDIDLHHLRDEHTRPEVGTGEWIFKDERYVDWQNSRGSELLWLCGGPGAGKTMLAKRVASEFLKELDHPPAGLKLIYHFVSPELLPAHETPTDATKLPPSRLAKIACDILYSILQQDKNLSGGYRTELRYQGNPGIFFTNTYSIWKVIKKAIDDCGANPVYFLIDGVDGLEGSLCKELIERILGLMKTRTVKIFLSSRHVPHVSNFLCKHTKINLDTSRFVKDDLETFVSHRLNQLNGWDDALKKRVRETLLEKAEGTFLWASLVIEDLSYNCSGPDFDDFFREPPQGLDDVYRKMLYPLSGNGKRKEVLNIIQSVAIALRPLTFGELAHILALIEQKPKSENQPSHHRANAEFRPRTEKEIRKYVQSSLGFLRATESTVSLVHHTAREYLFDEQRQKSLAVLPKSEAELIVSWGCFRYLHDAFSRLEKFPKGNVSDPREVALKDRQGAVAQFPCLSYAAESWFIHARQSIEISEDRFLGGSGHNWLQHQFFGTSDIIRKPWIELCGDPKMKVLAGDQTPLQIAVCLGLKPLVERVFSEFKNETNSNQSPLHLAAQFLSGIYKLLVAEYTLALLTAPDGYGNTPLHAATAHGHWPMVVELVKRFKTPGHTKCSDEINKKNRHGNTPLHLALQFDHPGIVEFLFKSGADRTIKNNDQLTPSELGEMLGRVDCLRILGAAEGNEIVGGPREGSAEMALSAKPAGEPVEEHVGEPEGEPAGVPREVPAGVPKGRRVESRWSRFWSRLSWCWCSGDDIDQT